MAIVGFFGVIIPLLTVLLLAEKGRKKLGFFWGALCWWAASGHFLPFLRQYRQESSRVPPLAGGSPMPTSSAEAEILVTARPAPIPGYQRGAIASKARFKSLKSHSGKERGRWSVSRAPLRKLFHQLDGAAGEQTAI
ncbi:hypothetical protein HYQ46_000510 [Verticillium longisporum]|nr:hypothetical protein HYQ46_000510 [Verticillium longisporum]